VPVAIAAAALGPYFRQIPPDQRSQVAAMWGLCVVFSCLQIGRIARKRFRLERIAGRKIVAVGLRWNYVPNIRAWGMYIGGGVLIVAGLFYLVVVGDRGSSRGTPYGNAYDQVILPLISATFIAQGIVMIWWQRSVQFREQGLLYGIRFLPWTHITDRRTARGALILEGVDARHADITLSLHVASEQQESVEAILSEKLPARIWRDSTSPLSAALSAVHLPPILIETRKKITLPNFAAFVAGYIGIIVVIFRPWGNPPVAFTVGLGLGVFAAVATYAFRRREIINTGPPLIRLTERPKWYPAVGCILLLVSSYFVIQRLPIANLLLTGAIGCACGIAMFPVLGQSVRAKVDLSDNGVAAINWSYWPWHDVQLVKWDRDGVRHLVLKRGWQRIAAHVRLDERDAVEALLSEKLSKPNQVAAVRDE
jgi:hypothetical protein